MGNYSYSKLETFDKCPLKYKYKYIDKIKIVRRFIEAFLGKLVHDTLEWVYKEAQKGKIPTLDEVMQHYSKNWEEKYSDKILIVKQHLTIKDYFNMGIKFLVDYYMKHQPFKDNTIATEKYIRIKLGEMEEHKIVGYIDRLVHNTENDEFEVHDYKTSSSIPEKKYIEKDRQLPLYSIAVKNEFGKKPVHLIWHYLAFNKSIKIQKTDDELEKLQNDILFQIKNIENTNFFPAKPSRLCEWCEFKSICPAWNT